MFFSSMSIQIFWKLRIITNIDVNVNDSAGKHACPWMVDSPVSIRKKTNFHPYVVREITEILKNASV